MGKLRLFFHPFNELLAPLRDEPTKAPVNNDERKALDLRQDALFLAALSHLDARESEFTRRLLALLAPLGALIAAAIPLVRRLQSDDYSFIHSFLSWGLFAAFAACVLLSLLYVFIVLADKTRWKSRWLFESKDERAEAVAARMDYVEEQGRTVIYAVGLAFIGALYLAALAFSVFVSVSLF